jgi:hypothetical protein
LLVYFRLCKSGYASSIREAALLTAKEVLQALAYDRFLNQYEAKWLEMNKGE